MKAYCYKVRDEHEEEYYQLGRKAGIKEVVDWLVEHSWDGSLQHWGAPLPDGSNYNVQCMDREEWQAKLKEWGIDEIRG